MKNESNFQNFTSNKLCNKLPDKKLHRRTLLDDDIIVVGLRRLCPVVFGTEPEAHLVLVRAAAVQLLNLVGHWGSHLDVLRENIA